MRFEDWPVRLDKFTRENLKRPFVWGYWDCCKASALQVHAITGTDFSEGITYTNRRTAYAALKKIGGMEAMVTSHLGPRLASPKMAQRGDVCLIETPLGNALGWCMGVNIACPGLEGINFAPLFSAKMAWRV